MSTKNKNTATKSNEVMAPETKPATTPKVETKPEATPAVKNEEKKNIVLDIAGITKLYSEMGIACKNPDAVGNYRIMKGKSSLNVTKTGYVIYTTAEDLELVSKANIQGKDLVAEAATNSQDKIRPNTVKCSSLETLKELLAVYAKNPLNQLVQATPATAVATTA